MNSVVDIDSPNYEYAQNHGYLFNKTVNWGHGNGRLLNYFNRDAVSWWHSQIKQLIDTVGPIHAFKVRKEIALSKYFMRHHHLEKDKKYVYSYENTVVTVSRNHS
jgi:alpha-glucosidase (family GH31 glycosyl hydrolase)